MSDVCTCIADDCQLGNPLRYISVPVKANNALKHEIWLRDKEIEYTEGKKHASLGIGRDPSGVSPG